MRAIIESAPVRVDAFALQKTAFRDETRELWRRIGFNSG
jgi:hypothetical protein